jgi:AcrR family transcriptional regulator
MGVRNEQKQKTRENILFSARNLMLKNGFIKVSTKEISTVCGVSQGTLFLHFSTKDNLLNEIISHDIDLYLNDLKLNCNTKISREEFLIEILDVVGRHESILSRLYKDYYYLDETLTKSIDKADTVLKNLFFDNLRNTPGKTISIVDSFILIDAFVAQLKYYLLSKDVYTDTNSIIRQSRGKLNKLFRSLFE